MRFAIEDMIRCASAHVCDLLQFSHCAVYYVLRRKRKKYVCDSLHCRSIVLII
jgi:hypothetical protein